MESKRCPNCDDVGYYAVGSNADGWEQVQCEFCYTVPDSVFNIKCRLEIAESTVAQLRAELATASSAYSDLLINSVNEVRKLEAELAQSKLEAKTDAERLDWLEQLRDTDLICDLVISWKTRNKRYPQGMRAAIDAAKAEESEK